MILLFALLAQDEFYKFKPETAWIYKRVKNDEEIVVKAKVLEDKDGKVKVDWKESRLDGTPQEHSELTWLVKDGILWAEVRTKGEDQVLLALPVLKGGTKKGDTWTTDVGVSTHHGAEEVKVAAGTYKDAVRTELKVGAGDDLTVIEFWMAPKVGLVKAVVGSRVETMTFDLKEFTPAKP